MTVRLPAPPVRLVRPWTIVSTPPMNGAENMAFDVETLRAVRDLDHPPTLRFFRWRFSGASYGKHQSLEAVRPLIGRALPMIQRPTGGGLVLHGNDLCFSLCWRADQPPLPGRLKDCYAWIHGIVADALRPIAATRLATSRDNGARTPLAASRCFSEPAVYDVLADGQKIAGGALCRQQDTFLYQGSIQGLAGGQIEVLLTDAFRQAMRFT